LKLATTMLVSFVLALLAFGMVVLYSASVTRYGGHYMVVQTAAAGIGLILCAVVASQDYRRLKKISWLLFATAAVLLALVFVPGIGMKINGARRWINLRVTNFQPSEFAKIALVIALAHYAERNQRQLHSFTKAILLPSVLIGVILGLIFLGKDYGTTILLATVSVLLLLIAGVRWRFLVPSGLILVVGLAAAIWSNEMRRSRVLAWLNPEQQKDGINYQVDQAVIALGSGGLYGLGLGNGRQKLGFVPENHTDFILSIIGEELGLVATLGVLASFALVVVCGVYIARRARDTFGMLLAAGMTFLIGLQAAINIGVVTGALPNKGLPLPFISYGGSNLLMMLISVGLLISVARKAVEHSVEATETSDSSDVVASQMAR